MSKVIEADFFPKEIISISRSNVVSPSSFNGTRRILVVDNNPDVTRLIKILLERRGGYVVFEENDPTTAHLTARNFHPDVILVDLMMPEMDGSEVAARIEHDPILASTPIIFLTALVTRAEAKSGLKIDGHFFLAKPVSIPEVIDAVERLVSAHAQSSYRHPVSHVDHSFSS